MKKQCIVCIALIALLSLVSLPLFSQGTAEAAKPAGPVTIELWYGAAITEAGPPPADWVGFQIIKDKLNIDLKLTALPSNESDQDVKVQAAAAANNLPDLFMVRRDVLTRLVPQGLIASVDDMYAKMPIRTKTHYDEVSRSHARFNGKAYGLADPGSIIKNEGLLIRKDWLDNLGLAVPTTTDELLAVMRAFTFNDPDGNGKNDTRLWCFQEINNYEVWPGRRLEPIFELVWMVRGHDRLCSRSEPFQARIL